MAKIDVKTSMCRVKGADGQIYSGYHVSADGVYPEVKLDCDFIFTQICEELKIPYQLVITYSEFFKDYSFCLFIDRNYADCFKHVVFEELKATFQYTD